ncbi:MAG: substrate-binding domain-containing protein [Bryobacterales bacterium]
MGGITNRLRELRERSALSGAALAERVGVTRQAIHAMESGAYAPNTAVALKLARVLGVSVEELFQLAEDAEPQQERVELLGEQPRVGAPLTLCQVGSRVVAAPWSPDVFTLPVADASAAGSVDSGRVDAMVWRAAPQADERLLLAGCDPAASLLADHLRRASGVELVAVPSSSKAALRALADGLVHMAGTHLADGAARAPKGCRAFTFAEWEEGLVVAAGNPKKLRGFEDLARPRLRIVNREPGAGSRALLDAGLAKAGVPQGKVAGYDRIASGHLAAALAVSRGEADCCVAPRVAAQVFGLGFLPLQSERYNLVIPKAWIDRPALQAVLDALQRASFRRQLRLLGGYDVSATGSEVS